MRDVLKDRGFDLVANNFKDEVQKHLHTYSL